VNVRLISSIALGYGTGLEWYGPAEEGSVTLETREVLSGRPWVLPLNTTDEFSVIVRLLPREPTFFVAPGLTFAGRHEWIYEYRFLGLKLRFGGAPAP
jgi:hypothetical protein